MKTAFALLVLALPAAAQPMTDLYLQQQAGAQGPAAKAAAQKAQERDHALATAVTAMRDGVAAGGQILNALATRGLYIAFATQTEAVKSGKVEGHPGILLSDALPAHPRVYAPLIAAEAAKGMFADMPACAEREYMRRATAARVFHELGGDFKALPKVDGDDAPAVKAAVSAWDKDSQTALDAISRETKLPIIPKLEDKAKDKKTRDALSAANKRFTDFLFDEKDDRAAALGR